MTRRPAETMSGSRFARTSTYCEPHQIFGVGQRAVRLGIVVVVTISTSVTRGS